MKFDHFNISAPMAVLEQVKDFYCQVFDMVAGERPNFSKKGYWLYLSRQTAIAQGLSDQQALIHLTADVHQQFLSTGYFNHNAFKLSGRAAFENRLITLNIDYTIQNVSGKALYQYFFKDPAGVMIEVIFDD